MPGDDNAPRAGGVTVDQSSLVGARISAAPSLQGPTAYGARLLDQHAAILAASGITPEHARARGYVSVDTKKRLEDLKVVKSGRRVPGLLIPQLRQDGSTWGWQYRPDEPRRNGDGKPVKYETPWQQRNGIDVPPGVGPKLGDPSIPLFVTEGVKKADSAACAGLACIALPGVWSWLGKNPHGGKVAVADWRDVALNDRRVILAFDSDVVAKKAVRSALDHLAAYLEGKDAKIEYLHLPNNGDGKTGLDDYLFDQTVEDLWSLVRIDAPEVVEPEPKRQFEAEPEPLPEPRTLADVHTVFRKWLGDGYDKDALNAVLAAAAAERLDGDPLWLLLISGSGNAKTETVQPLTGAGAIMTSTISSEGALLSGTSNRERADDATGGLLCKLGNRGVLIIKDVTSILSNSREQRAKVLAALREIYDGKWIRPLGVDGGRTLEWSGRIVVVGAVTTAWDRAHDVVAAMGDRFVLVRMDSGDRKGRVSAGRQAIDNTGSEEEMRRELAEAVGGVIAGMRVEVEPLSDVEVDCLLDAADLVTRARTGVDFDHQGKVIDSHAPEMPTRFAKQLGQVIRGAVAIGVGRTEALRLAIRCARDSMPPLRLAIVDDVAANPGSTPSDVRKRVNKPWTTIDRQMQALHMLEVLDCEEVPYGTLEDKHRWCYTLAEGINPAALDPKSSPDLARGAGEVDDEQPSDDTSLSDDYVQGAKSGEDSSGQLDDLRCRCGNPLLAPASQQRGICESCWLHGDEAGSA